MDYTVSRRTTRLSGIALVLGALLAGALAWPSLPDQMAIHWDATGTADGTAPKAVGVLLLPLLTAGVLGLYELLPRVDPLGENVESFRGVYDGFFALLALFLVGVHAVVLASNLGVNVPVVTLVLAGVGGVLAYSGVVMRHAEPNWFVGVRTPWTLSSETVWRRTHAVASWLFVGGGAAVVLAALAGWLLEAPAVANVIVFATVAVVAVVPLVYSYYCYATLEDGTDSPIDVE